MNAHELLEHLETMDVRLIPSGLGLNVDAPSGCLTHDLKAALDAHKPELLRLLTARSGQAGATPACNPPTVTQMKATSVAVQSQTGVAVKEGWDPHDAPRPDLQADHRPWHGLRGVAAAASPTEIVGTLETPGASTDSVTLHDGSADAIPTASQMPESGYAEWTAANKQWYDEETERYARILYMPNLIALMKQHCPDLVRRAAALDEQMEALGVDDTEEFRAVVSQWLECYRLALWHVPDDAWEPDHST